MVVKKVDSTGDLEGQLMQPELKYLARARDTQSRKEALEEYSHLWDQIDARLGESNELTRAFIEEYQRREYTFPEDPAETRRIGLMEASFITRRSRLPDELKRLMFWGAMDNYRNR